MTTPSLASPLPAAAGRDRPSVLRGLSCAILAMIVLPAQDAIAKYVSPTVSVGEINWARFALQILFTLPFLLWFQGRGGLLANRFWPNAVRGSLIATSSFLFFLALKFMPMADAIAIFFIEPFILVALSAFIDEEEVGLQGWVVVVVGFIGVLIVVRPSYDIFGPISLVPALGGFLFAIYVLMSRRLSLFDTPLTMQFTAGLAAMVLSTAALAAGWLMQIPQLAPTPIGAGEFSLLLLMGVFGTAGHLLFVQATRLAPSSLIAPVQYVEIASAATFGYLMFGDFPDFWKWVGIAVIVASGASVLVRQGARLPPPEPLNA